ncbi:MAG: hypothetical protein ACLP52_23670 [Streptosporangiaceae bacterium]|jgi:hypothetical protein
MWIRTTAAAFTCAAALTAASVTGVAATTAIAQAGCNPNTGCLPRPTDVLEVGRQLVNYHVRPKTLDILQNQSDHIYVTGLHWSRWNGGYGVHGLIAGSARGTGLVHATGTGAPRPATIYLWDVTNGGVNAFTYYDKMSIHRDRAVAPYWRWNTRAAKWQT